MKKFSLLLLSLLFITSCSEEGKIVVKPEIPDNPTNCVIYRKTENDSKDNKKSFKVAYKNIDADKVLTLIDSFKDLFNLGFVTYGHSGGASDVNAYSLEYFNKGYQYTFFLSENAQQMTFGYEDSSKKSDGPFLLEDAMTSEKYSSIISEFKKIYCDTLEYDYSYTDSFIGRY